MLQGMPPQMMTHDMEGDMDVKGEESMKTESMQHAQISLMTE